MKVQMNCCCYPVSVSIIKGLVKYFHVKQDLLAKLSCMGTGLVPALLKRCPHFKQFDLV